MGFRDRFHARVTKSVVDPMPHELASPEYRPPTLREQIQNAIRSEMSIIAQDRGLETFEEADDFTEDDPEAMPPTIYEQALMGPENDESLDGENIEAPEEPPKPSDEETPTPTTPAEASVTEPPVTAPLEGSKTDC